VVMGDRSPLASSAVLGSGIYEGRGYPRFRTLDDSLILLPPAFTPRRLEKMAELLREPTFMDVNLEGELGGFKVSMPIVVGSMGSTSIASRFSLDVARAAAKAGIVFGIGENVATVRGYSRRYTRGHPSFKERVMAYLTNVDKYGGVIIQQNEGALPYGYKDQVVMGDRSPLASIATALGL